MSEFYNVQYIESIEGANFGYFRMVQFNDYVIKDTTDRYNQAMALAEGLAATGKPVVVKEILHGVRCSGTVLWQSFNAKDHPGLLER